MSCHFNYNMQLHNFAIEIITDPQDKILATNSTAKFTCTSSISSNVKFLWTHNGRSISGSSTTGDTSILTITSVRKSDAGSYVCTVKSKSVSVMSNIATLTVYGMRYCNYCNIRANSSCDEFIQNPVA